MPLTSIIEVVNNHLSEYHKYMSNTLVGLALTPIVNIITLCKNILTDCKHFSLLFNLVRLTALMIYPLLPSTSDRIIKAINVKRINIPHTFTIDDTIVNCIDPPYNNLFKTIIN